jgi:hypothetical protein
VGRERCDVGCGPHVVMADLGVRPCDEPALPPNRPVARPPRESNDRPRPHAARACRLESRTRRFDSDPVVDARGPRGRIGERRARSGEPTTSAISPGLRAADRSRRARKPDAPTNWRRLAVSCPTLGTTGPESLKSERGPPAGERDRSASERHRSAGELYPSVGERSLSEGRHRGSAAERHRSTLGRESSGHEPEADVAGPTKSSRESTDCGGEPRPSSSALSGGDLERSTVATVPCDHPHERDMMVREPMRAPPEPPVSLQVPATSPREPLLPA